MSLPRKTTRQRLIQSALQLFAHQGITATTTRQIAELSEVNEVTLFRHFGSKYGLLLAVLEETTAFTQLGETLGKEAEQAGAGVLALQTYIDCQLQALEQIPEFIRSLVGESGQYPIENRQAIAQGLMQIQHYTTQYLATIWAREPTPPSFAPEQQARLLNTLVLGYAILEFTTEFHALWPDRQAFIADLVTLFFSSASMTETSFGLAQSVSLTESKNVREVTGMDDLPAPLVQDILQKARKSGSQDYALIYVLFAAGLSLSEIANLQRSHSICNDQQHLLYIKTRSHRQVPLNQWIKGCRYGSYTKNPLTQWLKTRKDNQLAIFINETGQPMSEIEIRLRWQTIVTGVITSSGQPPAIEQAQSTWCVEMLTRGMKPERLSVLTGLSTEQLQPYVHQAQEQLILEQAIQLDQRPSRKPNRTGSYS
jgi:AcrR family transcriptional regulator